MIAEAVGLNAAIDYINELGIDNIYQHEKELVAYAYDKMSEIEGIEICGRVKTNVPDSLLNSRRSPSPRPCNRAGLLKVLPYAPDITAHSRR